MVDFLMSDFHSVNEKLYGFFSCDSQKLETFSLGKKKQ